MDQAVQIEDFSNSENINPNLAQIPIPVRVRASKRKADQISSQKEGVKEDENREEKIAPKVKK